jgi:hypothetical protein
LGRLLGLILFVIAIYVGLTIYTEGTDRAFGGIFAESGSHSPDPSAADPYATEPSRSSTPITERVEERWRDYLDAPLRRAESIDDR